MSQRIGGFVKKLLLLLAVTVLLFGCKKNHPPEVTAVSAGPEVCLKDTSYTFTAIATDPDGDSVAVRFDWGDSTVSDWSGWFASGDTAALTHAWHSEGTCRIVAQARDQKLLSSDWSGAPSTTVVVRRTPALPGAPSGPDRGGQDSAYTFAAAALQPNSIQVAIRFAWGDGDTSEWSAFVASGESVSMSHAWAAPDTYAVRAQAKDTGNAPSLWSAPHSISIRPPDTLRKWRFQLATYESLPVIYLYSSPAIGSDGTIYVGSSDDALYAINPDGTLKWRCLTQGSVRSSPAIGADGTVYFGSDDNHLYALDPNDGTVKWSYLTSGHVQTAPAIAVDGTAYVGSHDNRLYALNPDGTLKWSFLAGGNVTSSPAIAADGTICFGSDDHYFYALNPDGTQKWRLDLLDHISYASAAIGSDGTVYCGSDLNRVGEDFHALNPDGTRKWSLRAGHDVRSSPAITADGTIYIGADDNYLQALNPDGSLKWIYQTGDITYSSPAIGSDGTIYVGSNDDFLYALNPDGTLKWRYETGGDIRSAPAIGPDGTVYFTSCDGYLYALKGTSPLADSPWPKFHHDAKNTGRVGGGR
jgi:outer membrane protein assembly factor BamB